jgi:hypothetical protein
MKPAAARSFFAGVLKRTQIEARDILPSLLNCEKTATLEPASYITKAADGVAARRPGQPAREPPRGVEQWTSDTWREALQIHRETGEWGATMGPPPGSLHCRAPPDLLVEFGFRNTG